MKALTLTQPWASFPPSPSAGASGRDDYADDVVGGQVGSREVAAEGGGAMLELHWRTLRHPAPMSILREVSDDPR